MSKESQRSPTKLSRKNVKEANKIIDQASKIKKAIDSVEKMHGPLVQKFAAWKEKATKAEEEQRLAKMKKEHDMKGLQRKTKHADSEDYEDYTSMSKSKRKINNTRELNF